MAKVVRADSFYRREDVEKDVNSMYIFTDNTDRNSGRGEIPNDSWYAVKYGFGKHFPKVTSAHIRGLSNAYPITTQRWYNNQHKGLNGRWHDSDFEEFKKVIDADFETIYQNIDKYEKIVFPFGGIFNSKIANISKLRTPKLFQYLLDKCKTLL